MSVRRDFVISLARGGHTTRWLESCSCLEGAAPPSDPGLSRQPDAGGPELHSRDKIPWVWLYSVNVLVGKVLRAVMKHSSNFLSTMTATSRLRSTSPLASDEEGPGRPPQQDRGNWRPRRDRPALPGALEDGRARLALSFHWGLRAGRCA